MKKETLFVAVETTRWSSRTTPSTWKASTWATPGKYTIGFGASVEDIRLTATYSLSKQYSVKCHDVMKPSMEL